MDKVSFKQHLKQEHQLSSLSTYIKEFVYGGNDGIVTTFAVVSGFSGANIGEHTLNFSIASVLLFGFANLFADGAAMGLGNFLSINSAKRLYKSAYNKEMIETKQSRKFEIQETQYLFERQGFNKDDSVKLTALISKNPDFWVKFMVQHECGLEYCLDDSSVKSGFATFFSFVIFGFVPLIPYFFDLSFLMSFHMSILCTFFALVFLGLLQAYITKDLIWRTVIETLFIGSLASSLAYIVGILFKYFGF